MGDQSRASYVQPTKSFQIPSHDRTSVRSLNLSDGMEGTKEGFSTNTRNGYKRVVLSSVLAIIALLIYSSQAYSLTDQIATNLGMDLFGESGEPGSIALVFHTLVYGLIIMIIIIMFCKSC